MFFLFFFSFFIYFLYFLSIYFFYLFSDEARKNGANILIHCQAGVSRSATVTIAYLLKHSTLTMTDAYRYVKQKRAIISPNFNFMGQLMEFEQALNDGQSPRICEKSQIDEIL